MCLNLIITEYWLHHQCFHPSIVLECHGCPPTVHSWWQSLNWIDLRWNKRKCIYPTSILYFYFFTCPPSGKKNPYLLFSINDTKIHFTLSFASFCITHLSLSRIHFCCKPWLPFGSSFLATQSLQDELSLDTSQTGHFNRLDTLHLQCLSCVHLCT